MFFDDNTDPASSELLAQFSRKTGRTRVIREANPVNEGQQGEGAHQWREATVWKVAAMKDRILSMGRTESYTHVFLADSDLLFHPATLSQLLQADRDIVCTVYWTSWQPGTLAMPQVWVHGEYEHDPLMRQLELSEEDKLLAAERFFAQLRSPGLYSVGGLGACTLISRSAIERGVNFREIPNLTYWGEDRHFCVRAAALGIGLFVETTYPAYHIYREEDLAGAAEYRAVPQQPKQRLTVPADAHSRGEAMLAYGYERAAMEQWLRSWEAREGEPLQQVKVVLALDAYYGRQGDVGRGRTLLLDALEELRYAELYCRLGSKCMDSGNWQEAASWFRAAVGTPRPEDWEHSSDVSSWTWKPYIQLCVCSVQLGETERALEYNERGLALEPTHPTMLSNRQALLSMLGKQSSTTA